MGIQTDSVAPPRWARASSHLRDHAFTWITITVALLLVWLVPQFHNLLFHAPAKVLPEERRYLWLWGIGSWLLVLGYVWCSRWAVAPDHEVGFGRRVWVPALVAGLSVGVLRCLPGWAAAIQDATDALPAPPDQILLLVAALLAPSPFARAREAGLGRWMQRSAPTIAIGIVALAAALHFAVGAFGSAVGLAAIAGLWLLVWRQRWPIGAGALGVVRLVLLWFTLFLAVGETLWILPGYLPESFSHEAYAVWAIYHGVFTLVACARKSDELARATPRFLTRLAILVGLLGAAMVFLQPITVGRVVPARTRETITATWFDALETRLATLPAEGPVVFVAVSGGGSRAAMFAAMVYEVMRQPDAAVEGEALRHALTDVRKGILAISSVSGGSLASAWYLADQTRASRPPPRRWVQSITGEVEEWTRRYANAVDPAVASAMPAGMRDRLAERVAASMPTWLATSLFVDEMARSFMAPLLRGMFTPMRERGEATSAYWEETFGWRGMSNGTRLADTDGNPLPLLLLNTTDVDAGRRLTLGFPSLPPGLLTGTTADALSDVDPTCELTLAEGVRLSANFPWGFCSPYLAVAEGRRAVCCTDGGVVDNTGVDSVVALLEGLRRHAMPAGADTPLTARARAALTTIRQRGVLLVVVDCGARVEPRSGLGRALPELTEPLRALGNADTASGTDRADLAVDLIAHILESDDGSPSGGVDAMQVVCHDVGGPRVITAWALSARDKAGIVLNLHRALARGETESPTSDLANRLSLFAARRAVGTTPARRTIDEIRLALRRQSALGEEATRRAYAPEVVHGSPDQLAPPEDTSTQSLVDKRDSWLRRAERLQEEEEIKKAVPPRRRGR